MDMRVSPKVKMKLVMVGNGMAGVRALEELLKLAPDERGARHQFADVDGELRVGGMDRTRVGHTGA